jgi:hypothetical protein
MTVAVHPVVYAALCHVKAGRVTFHSDGLGFQLTNEAITGQEQEVLRQLAANGAIHVSDPAVVGRAVVIDLAGCQLLAALRSAARGVPRRPLFAVADPDVDVPAPYQPKPTQRRNQERAA